MYTMQVLASLALLVGLVRSYNWDIFEGADKELRFYYNGTLTHTEQIPSAIEITSVTYDPGQDRVFFVDYNKSNMSICSFDLLTRAIEHLVTRESGQYTKVKVTYDHVTQVLFWKDGESIYAFSTNLASSNKIVGENLLVTLDHVCRDIAVDSCGGYIYWITDSEIERARLDGTKREVLIHDIVFRRYSLVIDQQTQKMYWSEKISLNNMFQLSIVSANLNGKDRATLYTFNNETSANSLAVSKDFIYWKNEDKDIWQLQKNPSKHAEITFYSTASPNCGSCEFITANYTLKEQFQGIESCKFPQNLVMDASRTMCPVPICHNYCLQGDCSVNDDGQPRCSCQPGYSGERCEIDACHGYCLNGVCSLNEEDEPVCDCSAGYKGARCQISPKSFCFEAVCSVSADGEPKVTVTLRKRRPRRVSNAVEEVALVQDYDKL